MQDLPSNIAEISDPELLAQWLAKYNEAYRAGELLVSDAHYDLLVERLRELAPDHPFLPVVEAESFAGKREVRHPAPMLSTEKAYDKLALERFVDRVYKEAAQIGVDEVEFQVTPKLDGLAARDDGQILATRGNGYAGYDITNAFEKGVRHMGLIGLGLGLGEIVVVQSYFTEHLANRFEHPRNMVVGIISSDVLNPFAKKALKKGQVHFVPYAILDKWNGTGKELVEDIEKITQDLTRATDYPMDGMVASVMNQDVRDHMGATSHHYRWQIAIKSKGETGVTTVNAITWQVGRTGNVTPVLEVEPLKLSGATIRRVTAHNAGRIRDKGAGVGALIEVIRSGEVIPKLESVVTPSDKVELPENCPVCDIPLEWNNDFLKCNNLACKARVEQRIRHWFRILGNADWFGIKTVERLVAGGFDSLEKIYAMDEDAFLALEFGPIQSKNLAEAINLSKTKPVEDWRFLAAFGISDLGEGDSRKILTYFPLEELLIKTQAEIAAEHGFGEKTSESIELGLKAQGLTIRHMLDLGFNLQKTPLASEIDTSSPIAGKGVVFTGSMEQGSRKDMEDQARALGAKVQSAVSGHTDFLVCGAKVGAKKAQKARELGVKVLTEDEYQKMLAGPVSNSASESQSEPKQLSLF
ncbi:MAG: DNA ligase [Desulfatibacillum sp.]|nr:DNA ligase [Desulfatibacillum sp.]